MIIGSEFSEKYQQFFKKIGRLSENDPTNKISVQNINAGLDWDRTEIRNVLEHFEELGYINIETIGGPLLYGHVTITESGIEKYRQLRDSDT